MKELTAEEKKAQKFIVEQVTNALDLLETHFKKYCDEVAPAYTGAKSTAVPMVYISESIKRFKESYKKGSESEDTGTDGKR
jgi:hypothetical protein